MDIILSSQTRHIPEIHTHSQCQDNMGQQSVDSVHLKSNLNLYLKRGNEVNFISSFYYNDVRDLEILGTHCVLMISATVKNPVSLSVTVGPPVRSAHMFVPLTVTNLESSVFRFPNLSQTDP
jgi:hypothetical protein